MKEVNWPYSGANNQKSFIDSEKTENSPKSIENCIGKRRRDLEFETGDKLFTEVSPSRGL